MNITTNYTPTAESRELFLYAINTCELYRVYASKTGKSLIFKGLKQYIDVQCAEV